MAFKFEELRVWQGALDISLSIHNLTLTFPKEELYILSSLIKRAADSIALNIAEGSQGQSDAEQRKFLGYALRSAIEVVCCLHIGRKRDIISQVQFENIYSDLQKLIISIQSFRNKFNKQT